MKNYILYYKSWPYQSQMQYSSFTLERNISSSSTVAVLSPIPTSFLPLPTHLATAVAPMPQDTSTDPGLTTSPPDRLLGSTSNQVVSVVIGAVLAVAAVVIIAVLLAILVFTLNRRREDRKMLYDMPHIVTPQAQNLDNPILTGGSYRGVDNFL